MNSLHELSRLAEELPAPRLDIDALVRQGEQRMRRRQLAAVLGSAAAVLVVIALVIGGATMIGPSKRSTGPINKPSPSPSPGASVTRPIVYSDVRVKEPTPGLAGDPIHLGDRVVRTGSGWVHMDVVDRGLVYTTGGYADDGRVWFTDGRAPEQIGSHACDVGRGAAETVVTGNSGPLAAWMDCTRQDKPQLVVYDTGSDREAAREPTPPECGGNSNAVISGYLSTRCYVDAVIGDHVYFTVQTDPVEAFQLDLATDQVTQVTLAKQAGDPNVPGNVPGSLGPFSQAYLDDIRSHPRGLVIGDSWETGAPTPAGEFAIVGEQLVPTTDSGRATSAFDTATRRPIHLGLPVGYRPGPTEPGTENDFELFEWLDDETVALVSYSSGLHDQDILTCHLPTGHCELSVPSRGRDRYFRVLQHEDLGRTDPSPPR